MSLKQVLKLIIAISAANCFMHSTTCGSTAQTTPLDTEEGSRSDERRERSRSGKGSEEVRERVGLSGPVRFEWLRHAFISLSTAIFGLQLFLQALHMTPVCATPPYPLITPTGV